MITMVGEKGSEVFPCGTDETVLEAAERAGFSLPYSCLKGVCSTCEGTLLDGEVDVRGEGVVRGHRDAIRFCVTKPRSDLEIRPSQILPTSVLGRKRLVASVFRITHLTKSVTRLELRLPMGKRCNFRAGQYLRLFLEGGVSRNYSMANPPQKNDMVELHIRRIPGGHFSGVVLEQLERGTPLTIELPYGQFSLNENSDKPIILMASGTGFAPVKSIIEDQIAIGGDRRIDFYWGVRCLEDLYLAELPETWAARAPWLSFTPVLSQPKQNWEGRTGWVQTAILADHPDLSEWEVYACGNPQMISDARDTFIREAGLSPDDFHADAFVSTGELIENFSL